VEEKRQDHLLAFFWFAPSGCRRRSIG